MRFTLVTGVQTDALQFSKLSADGLLPLMSATCFDPWFTDSNSIPFFQCCVLCGPWFSVCHSCRSQACNANLIFQIACETFARFVCSLENRFFRRCFTPEGPDRKSTRLNSSH